MNCRKNYFDLVNASVETVEPGNDRSLESWTSCPVCLKLSSTHTLTHLVNQAFEKHVAAWHNSDEFKAKKRDAEPFFNGIRDFVFGRPLNLENIVRCSHLQP